MGVDIKKLEEEGYSLPSELQSDFESLLFVGALTKSFELLGHHFVMRSIKSGEVLQVSQLIARYEGQYGLGKALRMAWIAASLELIDGEEPVKPILKGTELIPAKFEWISRNLYMPVVDLLFDEYMTIEAKQSAIVAELSGKVSGKSDEIS